jgi:RsmE family RNA methyltransferase
MNRIFLSDDDLSMGAPVTLDARYSRHVLSVLKMEIGDTLRIGRINGPRGIGRISDIAAETVSIVCEWEPTEKTLQAPPAVDLLLAMPRPKVLKRLLPVLASQGVGRLWLTNAEKVEANYFATHWLAPGPLHARLLEGLEQSGDTQLPAVEVIRRLKPFLEDRLTAEYPASHRFVLHPEAEPGAWRAVPVEGRVLIAVGPEGGWSRFELELWDRCGFSRLALGTRILRSDVACTAALASIHMARNLNR